MFLREFREALGLTQNELSGILNISQATIAKYEMNKVSPTSNTLLKYVDKLNANPTFLFIGLGPILLDEVYNETASKTYNLVSDITFTLDFYGMRDRLFDMLISEISKKFKGNLTSSIVTLAKFATFNDPSYGRPYMLIYYVFLMMKIEIEEYNVQIKNKRKFLSDILTVYKNKDIIENIEFFQNKKNIIDYIDIKFTDKDCNNLVNNYRSILDGLEKTIPASVIKFHREAASKLLKQSKSE